MTQMKEAWGKLMLLEQSRAQAWLLLIVLLGAALVVHLG